MGKVCLFPVPYLSNGILGHASPIERNIGKAVVVKRAYRTVKHLKTFPNRDG